MNITKKLLSLLLVGLFTTSQAFAAYNPNNANGPAAVINSSPVVLAAPNTVTAPAFTAPKTNGAYTPGWLVANSATAGSVVPMAFTLPSANGIGASFKSGVLNVTLASGATGTAPSVASGTFVVHLYSQSPTVVNGDGAAYSATQVNYCGSLTGTLGQQVPAGSDYSSAMLVPMAGNSVACTPAGGSKIVYGLLQVTGNSWTIPASTTYAYTVTLTDSQ